MNYTRKVFAVMVAAVVVVFLFFSVSTTAFPFQTIGVDETDMVTPVVMTGVWGLVPEQSGVQDLTNYVPITNFTGPTASYRNADGLYVVTFATNSDPQPGSMVSSRDGQLWQLSLGPRTGMAAVWDIGGSRTVGVAVWQTTDTPLPDDVEVILAAIAKVQ